MLWTFAGLADIGTPHYATPFRIEVIGHQWWWEARYVDSQNASHNVSTANELHIPTGEPGRAVLSTVAVIRSFWVPELTGKTDTPATHSLIRWAAKAMTKRWRSPRA